MTTKILKLSNSSIKILNDLILELDILANFYLKKNSKKKFKLSLIKKNLHKKLIKLSKKDRKLFGKFFDAAQCLPALHASNFFFLKEIKKIKKNKIIQIADYSILRLDLPDNIHNDPWHQEAHYYDAPKDLLSLWTPLVEMNEKLGRLILKDSNKLKILNYTTSNKRPYVKVKENKIWTKLKDIRPHVKFGQCLVFDNSVLHKSASNTSDNQVRISIQARYNFLDNKIYNPKNYIPSTPPRTASHQRDSKFEKKRIFRF